MSQKQGSHFSRYQTYMCQALVNRLDPLLLDDNTTRAINKVEKHTHKYTRASILVYNSLTHQNFLIPDF